MDDEGNGGRGRARGLGWGVMPQLYSGPNVKEVVVVLSCVPPWGTAGRAELCMALTRFIKSAEESCTTRGI